MTASHSVSQSVGRSLIVFLNGIGYCVMLPVDDRVGEHCAVNTIRWSCAVKYVLLPQACFLLILSRSYSVVRFVAIRQCISQSVVR